MTPLTSQKTAVGDPVSTFFDELERRGTEPLLRKVSGRVRFNLADGDRTDVWLVTVDKGEVTVSNDKGPAELTIRGQRAVFADIVAGRANAVAAVVRGALTCQGDIELLFPVQRIFPDPPRGWDPTADTRSSS